MPYNGKSKHLTHFTVCPNEVVVVIEKMGGSAVKQKVPATEPVAGNQESN